MSNNFIIDHELFLFSDSFSPKHSTSSTDKTNMTLSSYFFKQLFAMAEAHPQKLAVVLDEQSWTYGELVEQVQCVVHHLHKSGVIQGQIIYQCVERGLEMICGFLATMCVGGVYYALSPTEPSNRLTGLMRQIQGQYALVHWKTYGRLPPASIQHMLKFDSILQPVSCSPSAGNASICRSEGAAFIICTSGTTGRPKAVVHTHKSLSTMVATYTHWDGGICTNQDQNLQGAPCTWILHVWETASTLAAGGTLVLLRPDGHLDIGYLAESLVRQQVTVLHIGTGIIRALIGYLKENQNLETFRLVRKVYTGGNDKISN